MNSLSDETKELVLEEKDQASKSHVSTEEASNTADVQPTTSDDSWESSEGSEFESGSAFSESPSEADSQELEDDGEEDDEVGLGVWFIVALGTTHFCCVSRMRVSSSTE